MIHQRQGVSTRASLNRPRVGNGNFSSTRHLKLKQQRVAFGETDTMAPVYDAKPETFTRRPSKGEVKAGAKPVLYETEEYRNLTEVRCWVDLVLPRTSRQKPRNADIAEMAVLHPEVLHEPKQRGRRAAAKPKPLNLHPVAATKRQHMRFNPVTDAALDAIAKICCKPTRK